MVNKFYHYDKTLYFVTKILFGDIYIYKIIKIFNLVNKIFLKLAKENISRKNFHR